MVYWKYLDFGNSDNTGIFRQYESSKDKTPFRSIKIYFFKQKRRNIMGDKGGKKDKEKSKKQTNQKQSQKDKKRADKQPIKKS